MNLIPATGTNVTKGVVEVILTTAVYSRRSVFVAYEALAAIPSGVDYELVMVVEPSTASWEGVWGIAFTPGTLSWYNDAHVATSFVR